MRDYLSDWLSRNLSISNDFINIVFWKLSRSRDKKSIQAKLIKENKWVDVCETLAKLEFSLSLKINKVISSDVFIFKLGMVSSGRVEINVYVLCIALPTR